MVTPEAPQAARTVVTPGQGAEHAPVVRGGTPAGARGRGRLWWGEDLTAACAVADVTAAVTARVSQGRRRAVHGPLAPLVQAVVHVLGAGLGAVGVTATIGLALYSRVGGHTIL